MTGHSTLGQNDRGSFTQGVILPSDTGPSDRSGVRALLGPSLKMWYYLTVALLASERSERDTLWSQVCTIENRGYCGTCNFSL